MRKLEWCTLIGLASLAHTRCSGISLHQMCVCVNMCKYVILLMVSSFIYLVVFHAIISKWFSFSFTESTTAFSSSYTLSQGQGLTCYYSVYSSILRIFQYTQHTSVYSAYSSILSILQYTQHAPVYSAYSSILSILQYTQHTPVYSACSSILSISQYTQQSNNHHYMLS